MDASQSTPKHIFIMPDCGPCYATNEAGQSFMLSDCFKHHPNISDVINLKNQLLHIAKSIHLDWPENDRHWPWDDLNTIVLKLARKLALVLSDVEIPITFREHHKSSKTPKEIHISKADLIIMDASR